MDGIIREPQFHVFELKQALILLEDRVARLGQNLDQCGFVQLIEDTHDWESADEFGDETESDEVLRLSRLQHLHITALGRDS